MKLLASGGILCRNVWQIDIAGIFLFILKVPEKKQTMAQSAHGELKQVTSEGPNPN